MNECDFCGSESEHLYPINDGLWAICKECMVFEFETIPQAYAEKKNPPVVFPSDRYNIYGEEE